MLITDAQDIIKKPEEPATAGKGESMEFRLLIIEDEPDIRLMIEEALSLPGYRITSAEDGQQALQLFSEKGGLGSGSPGSDAAEGGRSYRTA